MPSPEDPHPASGPDDRAFQPAGSRPPSKARGSRGPGGAGKASGAGTLPGTASRSGEGRQVNPHELRQAPSPGQPAVAPVG
jgi:hypothetical protein